MNSKVDLYIECFIKHVTNWRDRLGLTEERGFEVSEDSLLKLRKKIRPFIEKIIKLNKDYLLTEEFCYYLVYNSLRMVNYQEELIKLLKSIIKANDKELISILKKYMFYVCFGDATHFDTQENYIKLMNQESLNAFNICMKCINNMYNKTTVRCYESILLTEILFNIYGFCVINHKLDCFDKLTDKYFKNPRMTIDHFINNGFMTNNYLLIDNFDDFIYKDMNIINDGKKII